MTIQRIIATADTIRIVLDAPAPLDEKIEVIPFPAIMAEEVDALALLTPAVEGDTLTVSRYACGRDGLCFSYGVAVDDILLEGKQYVEVIEGAERDFPYPVVDTKKGLQVVDYKDAKELGVRHSAINVNEGDFLMPAYEEGNTIEFEHDGRVFYFRKSHVERMDETFVGLTEIGCVISFILLNSPHWRCDIDPAFWDIIKHPAYTGKAEDGTGLISAFNLVTEEGLAYYRAFIAFLTDRYTREDMAYGRVVGMIVGNEVDAGYIWCNSGEMTLEDYVDEYAAALRVTWQTAASIYAHMRVFVSIDHFWTAAMDENQPLRYYKTRDMLVRKRRKGPSPRARCLRFPPRRETRV